METWGAHDAEHEAGAAEARASDKDGDRVDGGLDGHGDDDHVGDDGSGTDGGGDKRVTEGNKPASDSETRESKGGGGNGGGLGGEEEEEEEEDEGTGAGGSRPDVVAAKDGSKGDIGGGANEDGGGSDGDGGEPKRSRQHDPDAKFGNRTQECIETDHVEDSNHASSEEGSDGFKADDNSGGGTGGGLNAGGRRGDHDAGADSDNDGDDRSVSRRKSDSCGSSGGHDGGVGQKANAHETEEQFGDFEGEDVYVVDQSDSDVDPLSANEKAEAESAAAEAEDGSRWGGSECGGGEGERSVGVPSGGASDGDRSAHVDSEDGCGGASGGGDGGSGGSGGRGDGGRGSSDGDGDGDGDSPDRGGGSVRSGGEGAQTDSSGSDKVQAAPRLQDEARKEHRRKKRESRAFALWRRLYRRRWLRQYVENGMLVREGSTRVIGTDELFMDLIVVSCTSAVGQVLRKSPDPGFRDVEKFSLLFASVWGIWRDAGWLWNLFSSCGDLAEKVVVYLAMASLCGVGVSAPLAFTSDEAARGVGFSAFASSVFLGLSFIMYGWHEPILNHHSNLWNYATGYGLCIMLTAIPYLVAGALGSPNVRRALFWVAIGTVQSRLVWYPVVYRQVHDLCHREPMLPSVNVESLAEKAQLLTLIVLGESMLVLLLEGAAVLADGADLGRIMLVLALGTFITYSYHSVYFDIDKPVLPEGHHALRFKVWTGMGWVLGHLLFHMSLVLAAASLGWAVRAAALRTDDEADPFLRSERIIFSSSWAAVFCLSAGLASLHDGGPRAVTKVPRLITRVVLATALAVVLPLMRARLSALVVLIITTCVSGLIVVVEMVLNETDRLRWWIKVPAELKKQAEDAQGGSAGSGEEGNGHAHNYDAGTASDRSSNSGESDVEEGEDVEKGRPRHGRCLSGDGCWSWRRRATPPFGSVAVRSEADPPGVGSSGASADRGGALAWPRTRGARGRRSADRREERRRQRQYERADQLEGFSTTVVG